MATVNTKAVLDTRELSKLQNLSKNLQNKVIREANSASSRVIKEAVLPHVPQESGILKRSMAVRAKTYRSGAVTSVVGPRSQYQSWSTSGTRTVSFIKILNNPKAKIQKPSKYAHLVHGGTRPHQIVTRFSGRLIYNRGRWATTAKNFRKPTRNFTVINHPGSMPIPFMHRGYRRSESRALALWKSTASAAITRECK